jgi:hypothetical protein
VQHLDPVLIARDARFPGTGAQGVGYFRGPPMGMHVDHGCHGCFSFNGPDASLTRRRLARKARQLPKSIDGASRPRKLWP